MLNIDANRVVQMGPLYFFACQYPGKAEDFSSTIIDNKSWDTFYDCPDAGGFVVALNQHDTTGDERNVFRKEYELRLIWDKLHQLGLVDQAEMPPIVQGSITDLLTRASVMVS